MVKSSEILAGRAGPMTIPADVLIFLERRRDPGPDYLDPAIMAHYDEAAAQGKGFRGRANMYVCERCRGHVISRDIDNGVTPFAMPCVATAGCRGTMQSGFYRIDQRTRASHVWFRPPMLEFVNELYLEHVQKGGLLIREATAEEIV